MDTTLGNSVVLVRKPTEATIIAAAELCSPEDLCYALRC